MTRERIEVNGHGESYNPSRDPNRARWSNRHTETRVPASLPSSINLEDEEGAQFLRTGKRVSVRRGPIPRKTASQLKTVTVLAVIVALFGCLGWAAHAYGTQAPRFRIDSSDCIEISGVHNASRAQVMEVVGDDIGRNIFRIPLEERRKKFEQIPWVESATVMRQLPNRLVVSLIERTPVAFVLIGTKTSLIDANGVIMGPTASRQNKYRFPVLRGLSENGSAAERAEAMKIYNRLMRELESGDPEGQHLTNQLSEIDLSDPEDVKATVCDDSGTVLVHLGDSDFLQRYKLYAAHIGEWRRQYHNVQGVDLRWEGQIVVNPDGEHAVQAVPAAAARLIDPLKPDSSQTTRPGNRRKRQKRRRK